MAVDLDVYGLGYCPDCLTVWTDADARQSKNKGHCIYCKEKLEIPDIGVVDLAISCDACQSEVLYGVSACKQCGQTYSIEYWRSLGYEVNGDDEYFTQPETFSSDEIASDLPGKEEMLCCGAQWHSCDCNLKIDWYDDHSPVTPTEVRAFYHESKMCEECAYVRTAQCPMLREWLYDIHYAVSEKDGEELEQLGYAVTDGCSSFEYFNDVIYINSSTASSVY